MIDPRPGKAYLVCATPRSGSTLLCELLRYTGRAGVPLEHFEVLRHSSLPRQPREYFTEGDLPAIVGRLAPLRSGAPGSELPGQWWERILREGQTENGVWAGKLMWGHVEDLLARVHELPGLEDADLETALRTLLGDPEFLLVTRQDKVAQAVSLWKALQTQSWRATEDAEEVRPVYDFAGIDYLVEQLRTEERAWIEWFASSGTRPVEVSYEQLDAAPESTVASVLEALGFSDLAVPPPTLFRQRDELSSEWIERYREERKEAA
jgi:trehalose 2-sulfotransferase